MVIPPIEMVIYGAGKVNAISLPFGDDEAIPPNLW